jgi:hypothetical protein
MDKQHGHGLAAWTWKQSGLGHAAWTWICSMSTEMEHGHENAAWTSTCCMSKFISMLHVHVHAAWMSMPHSCMSILHINTAYPCPYLHFHVYATCPCLWCMSRSVLQIHVHDAVHVHAANPCPCYMSMSVLYVHVHAAGT